MKFAVIAAGEGSRLMLDGVDVPKPLVPLCGVPMVRRLIDVFMRCGATGIYIIVNESMSQVLTYLKSLKLPVDLQIVVDTTPSSLHSFYKLSPMLGDDRFVLTTVDTVFHEDRFLDFVRSFERQSDCDGMMAVTKYIADESPLYVSVDGDMRIQAFTDSAAGDAQYVSGGIYALTPKSLEVLGKCVDDGVSRMRNFQRALLADGLILKACDLGKIVDVDHASDIATAERLILHNS